MAIQLIESGRKFSEEDVAELKGFLSELPSSHLSSINRIERTKDLDGIFADSSPHGDGEQIRLHDNFYDLNHKRKAFVFLHEMGHNYFDFRDENEGDRSLIKSGACEKKDVSHLLRVQWMELGWELEPKKWERVKKICPENRANRDKYTYIVMYKNANYNLGEWVCDLGARIPRNSFRYAFRYTASFYSPKEEMADAYALFVLEKEHFLKAAEKGKLIKAKFDFIKRCFIDNTKEPIVLERVKE